MRATERLLVVEYAAMPLALLSLAARSSPVGDFMMLVGFIALGIGIVSPVLAVVGFGFAVHDLRTIPGRGRPAAAMAGHAAYLGFVVLFLFGLTRISV